MTTKQPHAAVARTALSRVGAALAAHASTLVLIGGCGAQVVFEASDETDPPPRATTEPETPDPCAAFTSHKACCEADCHLILVPGPFAFACLSEERDCARHPEVCTPDETCEVHDTPGDGGCSYGLDADSVGRCVPR